MPDSGPTLFAGLIAGFDGFIPCLEIDPILFFRPGCPVTGGQMEFTRIRVPHIFKALVRIKLINGPTGFRHRKACLGDTYSALWRPGGFRLCACCLAGACRGLFHF